MLRPFQRVHLCRSGQHDKSLRFLIAAGDRVVLIDLVNSKLIPFPYQPLLSTPAEVVEDDPQTSGKSTKSKKVKISTENTPESVNVVSLNTSQDGKHALVVLAERKAVLVYSIEDINAPQLLSSR
jgi:hypothetical protein